MPIERGIHHLRSGSEVVGETVIGAALVQDFGHSLARPGQPATLPLALLALLPPHALFRPLALAPPFSIFHHTFINNSNAMDRQGNSLNVPMQPRSPATSGTRYANSLVRTSSRSHRPMRTSSESFYPTRPQRLIRRASKPILPFILPNSAGAFCTRTSPIPPTLKLKSLSRKLLLRLSPTSCESGCPRAKAVSQT